MTETPKTGTKRKQNKQTLPPAGLTPLVTSDGDNSIIVSDSPPESQELKRRQRKSENADNKDTGNDPKRHDPKMAADVNKPTGAKPSSSTVLNNGEQPKATLPPENAAGTTTLPATSEDPGERPAVAQPAEMAVAAAKGVSAASVGSDQRNAESTKPRRGRPRKRGFSMDPSIRTGSDDMMSILMGIRQDNVTLKTDILSNLDVKMSQSKEGLAKKIEPIEETLVQHKGEIESVQKAQQSQKLEIRDLGIKVHGLEDEIDNVRQVSLNDTQAVAEQLSSVETSLAQDTETVRGHVEEKFAENKQ